MNEMVKAINPYEELGVPRDADVAEIRKAYREKCKSAHPDAGGTPEQWDRLQRAFDVLLDPGLRKTYDDTGRVEEDRPDNDRAAALQIIEMQVATVINAYITAGFPIDRDPRRMDIPARIAGNIRDEIHTARDAIAQGKNVLAFYADLRERFTIKPKNQPKVGADFIGRQLENQVRQTDQQIAGLEANIRVRELAISIVEGYDFRVESPYQPSNNFGFPDHIDRFGTGVWRR